MNGVSSVNNLAETLKRAGLVASVTEAQKMAGDICRTEHRVSREFNSKREEIEKSYESKEKTVQEIIEQTDPSKKDYFIPVKGYRKEESAVNVKKIEIESLPENKSIEEPETAIEETKQKNVTLDNNESAQDEELTLNQIMNEDAEIVYNSPKVEDSREKEVLGNQASTTASPQEVPKQSAPAVNLMEHFNFSAR